MLTDVMRRVAVSAVWTLMVSIFAFSVAYSIISKDTIFITLSFIGFVIAFVSNVYSVYILHGYINAQNAVLQDVANEYLTILSNEPDNESEKQSELKICDLKDYIR